MKFSYRKVVVDSSKAFPERRYILRPIIPVSLVFGGKRIRYEALIDSGADYTIFPAGLGRMLGLNIATGGKDLIAGVSGKPIAVYFHHIEIVVGDSSFKVYAGFADGMNHSILGQNGFFNSVVVKFDLSKKVIEIIPGV